MTSLLGLGIVFSFLATFVYFVALYAPEALPFIGVIFIFGILLVKKTPDVDIS